MYLDTDIQIWLHKYRKCIDNQEYCLCLPHITFKNVKLVFLLKNIMANSALKPKHHTKSKNTLLKYYNQLIITRTSENLNELLTS